MKYANSTKEYGKYTDFRPFPQSNPNLAKIYNYIENHNLPAPRVALFALRDIEEGEELTFNHCANERNDV